jgi:hypothetical protein
MEITQVHRVPASVSYACACVRSVVERLYERVSALCRFDAKTCITCGYVNYY